MSETKRYRLPEQLGGGEVEIRRPAAGTTHHAWMIDGVYVSLPLAVLTEIPPPTPTEPEPGAYLIGEMAVQRPTHVVHEDRRWLITGSAGWFDWAATLEECDWDARTDIVRLVALDSSWCECERWRDGATFCPMHGTHKPVELPWTTPSPNGDSINIELRGTVLLLTIDGLSDSRSTILGYARARELGWALLSAADRAEAGE